MSARVIEQTVNPGDPLGICDSLERKMEILKQFLSATTALREALPNQNPGEIDSHIQMRENCIIRINAIDDCIRQLLEKDPSYLKRLSVFRKEKIEKITSSIEDLLDQIKAVNKECIGSASRHLQVIQDEMSQTVSHRHNLQSTYGKGSVPRFLSISG